MATITVHDLSTFAIHLNDRYDGKLEQCTKHLDQAIFMLHFLQEDTFSSREVQRVVDALNSLKEGLSPP